VKLAVGDLVVYGNHGIGRVAARRKQDVIGEMRDVVVLEFEELTVTLPLALADSHLRPLASKTDLHRVGVVLREDGELNTRNWLSRRREALKKLIGGTPVELAEIVSEGAQRERLRAANGRNKAQLSLSERQLYTRARTLLADEVALALDIEPAAAEVWIDGHLMRPPGRSDLLDISLTNGPCAGLPAGGSAPPSPAPHGGPPRPPFVNRGTVREARRAHVAILRAPAVRSRSLAR